MRSSNFAAAPWDVFLVSVCVLCAFSAQVNLTLAIRGASTVAQAVDRA